MHKGCYHKAPRGRAKARLAASTVKIKEGCGLRLLGGLVYLSGKRSFHSHFESVLKESWLFVCVKIYIVLHDRIGILTVWRSAVLVFTVIRRHPY